MTQVLGDLTESSLQTLRQSFTGPLITPSDDAYEQARSVWNGAIDKRPGLIAQCLSVDDVVAAVNFARDSGVVLAVRGGGHSWAGSSTNDGGLVIDLTRMRKLHVAPTDRVAVAEGGVTWGE